MKIKSVITILLLNIGENMKKILFLIILIFLIQDVSAQNNTVYYCSEMQNVTGIYCVPSGNDIDKNAVMNNISQQYILSINDLELIQSTTPTFNQSGYNKLIWAVQREAQIEELILKFLKVIYQILI